MKRSNVARSVKRDGHVIVSTFGPEGPMKCSGLDVVRYDVDSLHDQFGRASAWLKFKGTAPHSIWHHSAISVLLLQSGMSRITWKIR